jgi:CheY-like chemotaxis protein
LLKSQLVLSQQAEQLRDADRRKDEFLATLAHELRNPLAPIRTGIDLLRASPSEASSSRALAVMDRQLKHMVRLIDDLLDVSRITQGRLELKKKRVELGTVLDAAIEASRPDLERNGHQLRIDVESRALLLDADPTRLAQVVSNLLNNASRYTPPRGVIEISAAQRGTEVLIEVKDNGIGIPEGQLSEVFEMFSRVNRGFERSREGLGIGLALVRTLVEMHGGNVSAASDGLGHGCTFSVRLPLADPMSAVDAASRPPSALPQHKKRILVVDDNEDAADMLVLMLRQAAYDTSQANDGPSALAAVEAFTPDLVILDIGLPGMSGYDVARTLRKRRSKEQLELIALTGWGSAEDKHKASEAGFDAHLTKPVDADMLYRALAELEQQGTT